LAENNGKGGGFAGENHGENYPQTLNKISTEKERSKDHVSDFKSAAGGFYPESQNGQRGLELEKGISGCNNEGDLGAHTCTEGEFGAHMWKEKELGDPTWSEGQVTHTGGAVTTGLGLQVHPTGNQPQKSPKYAAEKIAKSVLTWKRKARGSSNQAIAIVAQTETRKRRRKGDTDEEIGRDKRGRRDGQTMVEKDISESNVMGSGLTSAGFQHRRPQ
jgi:hypothetical protein